MQVAVRLLGVLLRLLNLLLAPIFWLKARDRRPLPPAPPPLLLRSATSLAAAIRQGEITSEELVFAYIDHVKAVNPVLNAIVEERYRAAIEDAKAVDRKIEEAKKNGTLQPLTAEKPLLGVPFTVKESCSLIGMSNAVGCLEHAGRKATKDGEAVRLVKQAGAIPLLVSNTPELCLGWETTNLLRGTTNNPYCLNRTPGGSSGGEGALLACGASALSVSSDIAGSIRLPAAFCGVFGHKPTPGLISIEGHIPTLSDENYPRFLTVGPMTRKAEDLPLMMNIMAGENRHKLQLDKPVNMKDLRVYYMTEAANSPALLDVHDCIRDKIKSAAQYLEKECGSKICEEKFKELENSVEISISVFFSMKDIPNMLQDPANPKRDKSLVLELIKYMFGGGSRSLQALGFALINKTKLFMPQSRNGYYSAKAQKLREHFERELGETGVFLYPVFIAPAHRHQEVFLRASGVMYTMVFNILGMPATTVPVGFHDGLPVAIQVVAAPNQDRLCLAVAKQLEVGFGGWRPPNLHK
ncbi:fatty-acid amide hydrolase 2-A-like isoform X2 [Galleria mellonella]|nr:fatty-acid amide hydrolase 2-A-like isoform X2 [Galleria mellonella]XP_052753514.1 fatty-acid amide hydrolase 2-A-like isoform X2 [Galleria mellonella]XP_052753515.1 fatty-acid amide hydrolase 2-A-like isoform X2 [Galleria mellonella]XP_052753516.1 fatty-acid amide hydrolase 2-A-like isoform X2 [Galleria mellonella]